MAARKRSLVKFYIRAREPMDAEISAVLDSFAAENGCDRSGAARHLILLGKRYWRDCGLQMNIDSIQRPKVVPTDLSEPAFGSQRDSGSNGQSRSETDVATGTAARSPSMVSNAHAPGDFPTSYGHGIRPFGLPATRPGEDASAKPFGVGSSDADPTKRLNAAKLRFRSKSPNETV
jgi:hypothetical protein